MKGDIPITNTAPPRPSTMPQEETSPQDQGLDKWKKDEREALFRELFNEAQGAISRVYLPGTMAHTREYHKKLFNSILYIEGRLNELWLAMREGRNTRDQFKGALKAWQDSHLRAIELYREGNLF